MNLTANYTTQEPAPKSWQRITSIIVYFLLLIPTIAALTMIVWTLTDDYIRGKIWYGFKTLSPEFINTWHAWQQYSWIFITICALIFFMIAIIMKKMKIRRLTLLEAIIIFFNFAIIAGMLHPMHRWSMREPYRCYESKINMWRIYSAIKIYQKNNGHKPQHLSILYSAYLPDTNIFFSPSGIPPNNDIDNEGYNYYPTAANKAIILSERANTRPWKDGINGGFVLLENGRFKWVSNDQLLKINAKTNDEVK